MLHGRAGTATIAGTTLRPIATLYATATFGARVRKITLINTTTTAASYALIKVGATTNRGAATTSVGLDINPPQCAVYDGHTGDGASLGTPFDVQDMPAAVGATIVWTFNEGALLLPVGTANGIGIIVLTGTGQICRYAFHWEE
jgi:hypothetical protein